MKAEVYVVIPVYNAFEESRECLISVLECSEDTTSIVVIDDASPSGDFREYLGEAFDNATIEFFRNDANRGFVGTCNRGMSLYSDRDVILLNSDTLVTPGWIEKLKRTAYSREKVGTVTPFSNNAVIASIPHYCEDNIIPLGLSLKEWASIVEKCAEGDYHVLPTCMGFCVYVRRALLNEVGMLDETFGKGYGEENDLSLRGQAAGFVDLLDHHTFIFHKGNCSFLGMREELSEKNLETIRTRYPHYLDRISKFCYRNPLRQLQSRLLDYLVERFSVVQPRVLHVLHNGPYVARIDSLGGTEKHVADLIETAKEVNHWSLVVSKGHYYLTAHMEGANREFVIPEEVISLESLIDPSFFDCVHIHHTRWFDFKFLCAAVRKHGRYFVSFHDFNFVCPRFYLLTPKQEMCSGFECASACGYSEKEIIELRRETTDLLREAKKLICFSSSTKSLIERILKQSFPIDVHPHGVPNINNAECTASVNAEIFRIALIGTITSHKGAKIIEEVIKTSLIEGYEIEWHLFGKGEFKTNDSFVDHGPYLREDLSSLIQKNQISVALFLSLCPETYSLVVDEAWQAGVPVIVGPYGAPADRVRDSGAGWIVATLDPEGVLAALKAIILDRNDYQDKKAKVSSMNLLSVAEEGAFYSSIYKKQSLNSASPSMEFVSRLNELALKEPPKEAVGWKLLGQTANFAIHLLDKVGVRGTLQKQVTALVPSSVLHRIKKAR